MNVIKLLKKDHDTVKALFDKFDKAGKASFDRKAEIFEQVRRELIVHTQAEEEIFYPAIKSIEGGRELIVEALKEHKEVDELLTQIARLEAKDPRFTEKVETLMDNVDHHVEEEEGQIFQFAEKNCPEEQLQSLGIEIEERKRALDTPDGGIAMRAVCWEGKNKVKVEQVPDPAILNPHDAIVKVTLTAICGSDLHIYDGFIPTMKCGDVLGHEFMGEVVEVGRDVKTLSKGDWVVVPFAIACGQCFFCKRELYSLCDNTNPNAGMADIANGYSGAGLFGYSHLYGGYSGGQAEYVRVPFADVGPLKIYEPLRDEQVLFLSDILPTGYMAADNANIQAGDTVAVWGCGPVGLFAIKSAYMLGAERVIAIDRVKARMRMAQNHCNAEVLNYEEVDVLEALREMTGGRGPDSCIEAVGMESHGATVVHLYDRAKQAMMLETDRPQPLRQAIYACRKGGTVSVPGVYGGVVDKFPIGVAFAKGLTFKMGQTHVQKYMRPLLDRVKRGDIDPSFVVTHKMTLDEAPQAYDIFKHKEDECIKVVLKP